jgi:hypothetical protein
VDCTLAALSAKKTASGSFDRKITWDLTKTVDDDSHSGTAGQAAGTSKWSVEATKSVVDDNYKVTGEITIANSSAIAQTFSVTDKLDDGTVASVDCPNLTVPAGESVTCTYTASPTKDAAQNTATISAPGNQDVSANAQVSYTANVTGDEEVTLADPSQGDFSQPISDTTTKTFPETFTCPSDPAEYIDGKKSFTDENIATLKGATTDLKANASVKVDCTLAALTAKKTANGSFDRTITWGLNKTVGPQSTFSGLAGDSFNATWSVNATKSVVDGNYKVTGTITVTNPSSIAQTFNASDKLDDGTVASVDCSSATGDQASATVPAGGSVTCTYTAATAKATQNTATVSAPGNKDVTANAQVSYTPKVIGDNSVTLADPRFSYSQLISGNTAKTFPETFKCPTDRAAYNSSYLYTKTFTNTATLKGLNTNLSKSATVTLNCRYPWQSETATGFGTRYPGTSNWFMYTAYTTNKVDLIAGQNYDAGDIYMTRSGSYTYVKVTLASGFRWANMRENLKIQPFAKAPTSYVQPGNFKYKFTVTPQSTVTYTAKVPNATPLPLYYGIHADVERYVP